MLLYAVFKYGVYRQECGGVFSTLESAVDAAERFIVGECDDYHSYEVVPFELDIPTSQTPLVERVHNGITYFNGGKIEESKAVYLLSRNNGVVSMTPVFR